MLTLALTIVFTLSSFPIVKVSFFMVYNSMTSAVASIFLCMSTCVL